MVNIPVTSHNSGSPKLNRAFLNLKIATQDYPKESELAKREGYLNQMHNMPQIAPVPDDEYIEELKKIQTAGRSPEKA